MSETYFRFRHFTIQQQKSAMKVGTDAVLLGSWVNVRNCKTILDIGSGSGVISLMLAQKSEAMIYGIDIDKNSCLESIENAQNSPWKDRINITQISLQKFTEGHQGMFDLIVSNPPYFENTPNANMDAKTLARHTHTLPYLDLIKGTKELLKKDGRFCLILPYAEGITFVEMAYMNSLFCREKKHIFSKRGKPEKRTMMEFSNLPGICEESELVMLSDQMQYTEEFIELTKDFYPDQAQKNF